MATLKDIAEKAGVSCTTVSNVIHGKPSKVSEKTRQRIQKVITDLNYVPNMSARSLVSNSSKVIGMINHIITRNHPNFMDDPFQSSFIGAIEQTLREHGYYLMLRTIETPEEMIAFSRNWNVDGLFFTGIYEDEFFDVISTLSPPVVLIDSYVEYPNIYNVGLSDFDGSYASTKHLIDNNHKIIAFASPPIIGKGVLYKRFQGYKVALKDAGIPFDESLVFESEMDIESCHEISKSIAQKANITAIVTTADVMAGGLIAGLRANKILIPEGISIVGFDNINICRMLTPLLTTIHQDIDLKGKLAVDIMLKLLNGEKPLKTNYVLPIHLVERDSVLKL